MADTIPGQLVIQVGNQNESIGSDSLYTAFNKTKDNFTNLFAKASSFTSITGNSGINVTYGNSNTSVDITNTGVLSLTAADSSIVIAETTPGNLTIAAVGGGNGGGGISSVGLVPISNTRLSVSGSPLIGAGGNITIDLATTGITAGTYTYPTMTVDAYGRITTISSATAAGTVTSVAVVPGDGIQVTGSPITTSGNINIINTGVTRLNAGAGISLSSGNGNVTISAATTGGTVTSVGVSSNALVVTGSPVTTTGTITVDLPSNVTTVGSTTIGTFLRLTPQASAPSSPTAGMVYYHSGSNTLKCYNGTSWLTITMA